MSSPASDRPLGMTLARPWCRVTLVAADGTVVASWALAGPGAPDLSVVDRLARLQLTAGRAGGRLVVDEACPELCELLALAGLDLQGKPLEG